MAAVQTSYKDGTQSAMVNGSDVLRITQVDEAGTVLTAAASDFLGNDGGSIYELPFKRSTTWEIPATSSEIVPESGIAIGSTISAGQPVLRGEFLGDLNKFAALSSGTGKHILEELLLSGLDRLYFKACYYETTSIPTAAAPTTSTVYMKRILWMCKFLPGVSKTFQANDVKIVPFTIIPENKDSATELALRKGGKMWKNLFVNSIQAIASETFESQTEATT